MSRYIDADHLLSEIEKLKQSPWFNNGKYSYNGMYHGSYLARKDAFEMISRFCIGREPIADVEPVRHGYWLVNSRYGVCKCSECGIEVEGNTEICQHWNYCPNCSAKMDRKGAHNDRKRF